MLECPKRGKLDHLFLSPSLLFSRETDLENSHHAARFVDKKKIKEIEKIRKGFKFLGLLFRYFSGIHIDSQTLRS